MKQPERAFARRRVADRPASDELALLSSILGELESSRAGRAVLSRLGVRRLVLSWLRKAVVHRQQNMPDDVTVLIGIRDRSDHRLGLALQSIMDQRYPAELVRAVVVDYGSEPSAAERTAKICQEYRATCVRVETSDVWSRSRCLNIGIRRAATKFLLTSDVDILFSPEYLAEAVRVLSASPLSVVCSRMLDLPETALDALERASSLGAPLRLREWRSLTTPRFDWEYHPSIAMTYTAFFRAIRGYDEFFELWGSEDMDLFCRLEKLGLRRSISGSDGAFYLHQWHPKYENVPLDGRHETVRRNEQRWRSLHTIVRNDASWGGGRAV